MELAYIVLLHLSYLTFLGSVAARIDFAPELKKKWGLSVKSRVRRNLKTPIESHALAADASSGSPFIKEEDVKDLLNHPSSTDAHIRVKRYRNSLNNFHHFQSMRVGCRFGTCTVQNLAHQIFQYTDKDKDGTAPANKISPQGYGRRRRSVPEHRLLLPIVEGKIEPWWVSTSKVRSPSAQPQIPDIRTTSSPSHDRKAWTKSKMWQTLLRT
ncbi:hypothetical protein FKM82_003226 [Ascaphus truei]